MSTAAHTRAALGRATASASPSSTRRRCHRVERHRHPSPRTSSSGDRQGQLHGRRRAVRRRHAPRRLDALVRDRERLPVVVRPLTSRSATRRTRSVRPRSSPPGPAPIPATRGATMSAWPRTRRCPSQAWDANQYSGGVRAGRPRSSRLQTGGTTYVPIAPVRVLDTRDGHRVDRDVHAKAARSWQVAGCGPDPDRGGGGDRQRDRERPDRRAATSSVTVTPTNNPATSTINFPARPDPGQQRHDPAVVGRQAVGRVRGRSGQEDPPPVRRDRLLPGRRNRGPRSPAATPVRVLDTRTQTSGLIGKFVANSARTLRSSATAARRAIPTTATAVTGNLTIVKPDQGRFRVGDQGSDRDPGHLDDQLPGRTRSEPTACSRRSTSASALSIVYRTSAGGD